jgi:hypothetical protein
MVVVRYVGGRGGGWRGGGIGYRGLWWLMEDGFEERVGVSLFGILGGMR